MVQAYAHELLNQKEASGESGASYASNPLYEATERLMLALDRLEGGLRKPAGQGAADPQNAEQLLFFERENESLRQEREALNTTIDELKHQYGDLHKAASTIYNKLNDSIKRLTQIIGE